MNNANNKKRTFYNFIFLLISQILTIALGLIVPRITLVGYGSDVNGLVNSVREMVAYLVVFEAGIQAVAKQSLYKTVACGDFKSTNEILSAVNKGYRRIGIIYLCGLIMASIIYPFFTMSDNLSYYTIFLVVFFSGLGNVVAFFFQGKYKILLTVEGRSYVLTNVDMLITILNNIAKIVLLYLGINIVVVIIASFLTSLLQTVYILIYIKKKYKWINLHEKPNFGALKQNKAALVHQISGLIFSNTDVLLLTLFCGLKVVSVYSVYKLLNDHICNFVKIPADSCGFALGQLYNSEKEKYKKRIDALELLLAILAFSAFAVVLYFITPFMAIYTHGVEDINYIDKKLAILFVCYELLNICRIPMLSTINYAGHFKQTISRTIGESALNVVVSVVGVLCFGIYGVLLGTIVALLYRTTDIIIYANKKLLDRKPLKTFFIYGTNLLIFIAVSVILNLIKMEMNTYFDLIKYALIITPIVFAAFFGINFFIFREDIANIYKVLKYRNDKCES